MAPPPPPLRAPLAPPDSAPLAWSDVAEVPAAEDLGALRFQADPQAPTAGEGFLIDVVGSGAGRVQLMKLVAGALDCAAAPSPSVSGAALASSADGRASFGPVTAADSGGYLVCVSLPDEYEFTPLGALTVGSAPTAVPPPPAPPPPPLRVPVEEPVDLRFAPQQAEAGERFHLQPVSNWACLRVVPAGASCEAAGFGTDSTGEFSLPAGEYIVCACSDGGMTQLAGQLRVSPEAPPAQAGAMRNAEPCIVQGVLVRGFRQLEPEVSYTRCAYDLRMPGAHRVRQTCRVGTAYFGPHDDVFAWGSDHHCAREGESLVALQTGAALQRRLLRGVARWPPTPRALQRVALLGDQFPGPHFSEGPAAAGSRLLPSGRQPGLGPFSPSPQPAAPAPQPAAPTVLVLSRRLRR